MKLINSKFIASAQTINDSIFEGVSEVAILGRSNVGKSSFINALTNHNGLAKKSSTPGKTKLINFFSINFKNEQNEKYEARLVDLPGFGYAKVSKAEKKFWAQNLTNFIENRNSIRVFVHLIDSRHPSLDIDKDVSSYLQSIVRPDQKILNLFTKVDKIKQKDKAYIQKLYGDVMFISNVKKTGINEVINKLYELLYE
jgi:GTP-binding protein